MKEESDKPIFKNTGEKREETLEQIRSIKKRREEILGLIHRIGRELVKRDFVDDDKIWYSILSPRIIGMKKNRTDGTIQWTVLHIVLCYPYFVLFAITSETISIFTGGTKGTSIPIHPLKDIQLEVIKQLENCIKNMKTLEVVEGGK